MILNCHTLVKFINLWSVLFQLSLILRKFLLIFLKSLRHRFYGTGPPKAVDGQLDKCVDATGTNKSRKKFSVKLFSIAKIKIDWPWFREKESKSILKPIERKRQNTDLQWAVMSRLELNYHPISEEGFPSNHLELL